MDGWLDGWLADVAVGVELLDGWLVGWLVVLLSCRVLWVFGGCKLKCSVVRVGYCVVVVAVVSAAVAVVAAVVVVVSVSSGFVGHSCSGCSV